MSGSNAA